MIIAATVLVAAFIAWRMARKVAGVREVQIVVPPRTRGRLRSARKGEML